MKKSLVLGFFDGVHLGHRAVIESAVNFAPNGEVILLTFEDSPVKYFKGAVEYILPRKESIKKIKSFGVTSVVTKNFEDLCQISAEDYLKKIVNIYHPNSISTGFNYTFGCKKTGNALLLAKYAQELGYNYLQTEPFMVDGEIVSSTLIKNYLKLGNIIQANKLLGYNFTIEGKVIYGAQLGRKLGFPTANITYPEEIVKIPYGVYAVKFGEYNGIMNYGIKPTLGGDKLPLVEVHFLDFNQNLYDKTISIELVARIRDEQKFQNLDELKTQIQKDKEECLKLLL